MKVARLAPVLLCQFQGRAVTFPLWAVRGPVPRDALPELPRYRTNSLADVV